jgi:hypothetical protein
MICFQIISILPFNKKIMHQFSVFYIVLDFECITDKESKQSMKLNKIETFLRDNSHKQNKNVPLCWWSRYMTVLPLFQIESEDFIQEVRCTKTKCNQEGIFRRRIFYNRFL